MPGDWIGPPSILKKKYKKKSVDVSQQKGTALNSTTFAKIITLVRAGNYLETAAASADISAQTVRLWLKKGDELPGSVYHKFSRAFLKASAEWEASALANIDDAARGRYYAILLKDENGNQMFDKDGLPLYIKPEIKDWTAQAYRLEKKFPEKYGKRESTTSDTSQAPIVQIILPSNGYETAKPITIINNDEVPLLTISAPNKENK